MSASPSRIYRFEGFGTRVAFDAEATRRWLDEALVPWFDAVDAARDAAVDYRLELARDPDPARSLGIAPGRAPDAARACFALDSMTLEFPAWETAKGVVLHDARYETHFAVGPGRTRLVAPPRTLEPRVPLLRSVRELAAARQRGVPGVLALHAAGFGRAGRSVLVLGPKESGKTTLLLHLLATGELSLVTNDRAFVAVDADGGAPRAIGVPTFVRVRPGTLAIFPELSHGLPENLKSLLYSAGELARLDALDGTTQPSRRDGYAVMTPAQLCRQLGVEASRGGPLAAVLLPERVDGIDAWQLERLDEDAACAALLANRYGLAGRRGPATVFQALFADAAGPDRGAGEPALARLLASRVPVLRCRVGVTRGPEPERAAALLRQLPL